MKSLLIRLAFNNTLRKKIWARIAMQLKYGVPLLTIFQNLAKQYKNNTVLSEIFENICAEYHKGLSEALKKYVPYDELMLIESCESGGKLHEGFELAERIISAKDTIRKTIKSALAYPSFLFALLIVMLLLVAFVLVPSFEGISNPAEWQGFGYLLYVVSSFLGSVYGAIFGILFVFGAVFTFYSFPNYTGEYRTFLDKFPPFSIYRMIVGSTWLFTFSSMMKAGKQQVDILHDMASSDISTPYLKDRIKKILENFGKKKFGDALLLADTGFPDEELINDLRTYAELPEFEDKLYKISEDWIRQGEEKLTEQAKIVQTICLISITVIIIGIILAYKEISTSLGGI